MRVHAEFLHGPRDGLYWRTDTATLKAELHKDGLVYVEFPLQSSVAIYVSETEPLTKPNLTFFFLGHYDLVED